MTGLRHEEYGSLINKYPFSLYANLERTPYNLSKEQNWHENIELQLCISGKGTVLIDGERYEITKGDVVAVDSNAVHYTFTDNFLCYTCLIVSTEWCKQMNINYQALHFSPIIKNQHITELIMKLTDIFSSESDGLCVAKANKILLEILIDLAENHSESHINQPSKSRKFDVVKSAVTYIQKNFERKLTLSEIAESLYLDKYTLCKEFKRYTGHTVVEYMHICRCMRAKEYLVDGKTVSETALLCGFENMSFFTRIFKRYTGENPSYYKK